MEIEEYRAEYMANLLIQIANLKDLVKDIESYTDMRSAHNAKAYIKDLIEINREALELY